MIKYDILCTKKEMGNLYVKIMDAGRNAGQGRNEYTA